MAATPSHIVPRAPLSTDYPRDAYENETEELKNAFMLYLGNDLVRKGPRILINIEVSGTLLIRGLGQYYCSNAYHDNCSLWPFPLYPVLLPVTIVCFLSTLFKSVT